MILESKYQLYAQNEKQEFTLQILMGFVFFERSVVVNQKNQQETAIERTDNKNRERPDAHQRHGDDTDMESNSNLELVDTRDFEWMAWNYRLKKMEDQFVNEKDMVAQMFIKSFSFLPTA